MKDECIHLFDVGRITRGQIKGIVYSNSENLADLLVGKNGPGMNRFITQVMNEKFPDLDPKDWNIHQVKEHREKIIIKAKEELGIGK